MLPQTRSESAPSLPEVRNSIATKAAIQTALLSASMVAVLALVSFLVARTYLNAVNDAIGIVRLASAAIGSVGVLIVAATLVSRSMARKLTEPLRRASAQMAQLGPGHWSYQRSAFTGDEVEVLDRVTADMSVRLEQLYDHLEEEVRSRTQELREQYERDSTILRSIRHGIVVTDARAAITDANVAALEMLQSDSSIVGRPVVDTLSLVCHGLPAEHPVQRCVRERIFVGPEPDVRWSLRRPDGSMLPVTIAVNPVLDGESVIGAIAVFEDVTEARKVDYIKSEFISLASHQLRTPISMIEWYLELLTTGEQKLTQEQAEYVGEMSHANKRMVNLVDALLRATRLEGGSIKPTLETIDIAHMITDLGEELRTLAKDRSVSCVIDVPTDLVQISTDPVLLNIVFQNLFSNAVKYTTSGGNVRVALTQTKEAVTIAVTDSGIGIPQKDQARIFEKLYRASNVLAMDTDGNGLGLYISKMILESIGGVIAFESKEGKGTTFTVKLPLR